MKSLLQTFLTLVGWTGLYLVACAPAPTTKYPPYCYDKARFTAAILLCTEKSSTPEESYACRRRTNADCGFVEKVSANHE